LVTLAAALGLCAAHVAPALAGSTTAADTAGPSANPGGPQAAVPQESFFSSLKQAIQQDYDHAVIRGHFDLGSPPDTHRYYCLIDTKTGKALPNGVSGQPVQNSKLAGTRVKVSAVSLYSCASAEQQGILVTTGYTVNGATPVVRAAEPVVNTRSHEIDVAGVKLGMSPDEVRAVLKSKTLLDYSEQYGILRLMDAPAADAPGLGNLRFVNVIAAWTPAAADTSAGAGWESYEVMFTPVPGKERVMAIVHSTGYSASNVLREATLREGLARKYGGFPDAREMPSSPTWRVQGDGSVQVGDACDRRKILGGLKDVHVQSVANPNLALTTAPEEFAFQIARCGNAIVTEDHAAVADPTRNDRVITRVTITAYSPSIGISGATAAGQLIQTTASTANHPGAGLLREVTAPNL
jgi:hypothetical protein